MIPFGIALDPAGAPARRSLLGVRALDLVRETPVTRGLIMTLRPASDDWLERPPRRPVQGPSGIFSFHDLPGMRDAEVGGSTPPGSSDPSVEFVLEVHDRLGRYLPAAVGLTLPRAQALLSLSLLPGPSYVPPPGWGRLRGGVARWEPSSKVDGAEASSAAWSRVEAAVEGTPSASGLADHRGEFALFFPLSDPLTTGGGENLAGRTWAVEVTVRYDPTRQDVLAGTAPRPGTGRVPSLASLLAQPEAPILTVWADGGPPTPSDPPTAPWAQNRAAQIEHEVPLTITTEGSSALWVHAPSPTP